MNRREFLRQSGLAIGAVGACGGGFGCAEAIPPALQTGDAKEVVIISDPTDAVASGQAAQWAIAHLGRVLSGQGMNVRTGRDLADVPKGTSCIVAAGAKTRVASDILKQQRASVPDHPESLALAQGTAGGRSVLLACGHDTRGLIYALTEIADAAEHSSDPAAALTVSSPIVEKPANQIRSNMRLFSSDVEDKPWFNDRGFWERYLTMLVSQRFNRFNLALGLGYDFPSGIRDAYFYFAYPFLLSVPGYNVRVPQLPDAERDKNLEMLRFISDQCAARGLIFQLGIWTHAYQWTNSPNVNYTVEGLGADNHASYCRDAVRILLRECPNISGVTFRIHGESGVPEGSYDFWKAVFEGVKTCGRPVTIDMHAKGMDQPMIDIALATGLPITISPKYWAEHMGLPYHQAWIRSTELPRPTRGNEGFFSRSSGSRSFLRYGYGDLLHEDRKYGIVYRMWPGTQRLLLWGDPEMAAAYGRASSFCGGLGIDLFEPLSFKGRKGSGLKGGRDAYAAGPALNPLDDWQKYRYSYRLWGRLTYNPDAAPQTYRRELQKVFGGGAQRVEMALGAASRILPLITTVHLPSAANNSYWPEIYTNMPIVDASRRHPYGDTPSPKRFGTVSPLDPQLFSRIDDFAEELLKGDVSGKYSPAEVAQWLIEHAHEAPGDLPRGPLEDVEIQRGIGRFFAWKFRASVLYALFDRTGDAAAIREALKAYRAARDAWNGIVEGPAKVYRSDITFGLERQLRGHWKDRLAAIDADIADMEKRSGDGAAPRRADKASEGHVAKAIAAVLSPALRPAVPITHAPPAAFSRGKELTVNLSLGEASDAVTARLFYRHVNQAEPWQVEAMQAEGPRHRAAIPAAYSDSEFPLQYYFELRQTENGAAWLYPGFNRSLTNQPYLVIRQA